MPRTLTRPSGGIGAALNKSTVQPDRPDVDKPTLDQFVDRIIAECRVAGIACSRETAIAYDEFLARSAAHCRATRQDYIVPRTDLARFHDTRIMDATIPDLLPGQTVADIAPADGSAWAMANRRHLDGTELTFEHRRMFDYVTHCTMYTHIRAV